jgi:hypothetical protein
VNSELRFVIEGCAARGVIKMRAEGASLHSQISIHY